MSKTKLTFILIGCFIAVILIAGALNIIDIGFYRTFEPMREDARREVFENTRSYVHGKLQDLAKYYQEYQEADDTTKLVIKSVIQIQFAEFDADNVKSDKLKMFLIGQRGF